MVGKRLRALRRLYYPLQAVRRSLEYRDIRRVFVASLILFSLMYALASGMLFRTSINISTGSPVEVNLALGRPLGVYPWLTIVFGGSVVFSANLTAMLFLLVLSVLFASNMALLVYIRRYASQCCNYDGKTAAAATVPALFSTFACCGGGLTLSLFSYVLSLGVASAYAAVIITYGWVLALISALLLYWNIYRVSRLLPSFSNASLELRFRLSSSKNLA